MAEQRRIAVIAGDGIGPEVTYVGLRALAWARERHGVALEIWELPLGAERWLKDGVGLPAELLEEIRTTCSGVLLGALGDARIPGHEHAREILFGLRFGLDLYVNLRPMRSLAARLIPLRGFAQKSLDITVFRENTEGLYAGIGGQLRRGSAHEVAVEEDVNTRLGVERIVRAAFDFARRERRKLCMSDKSNALRHAHDLWQRVFAEVSAEYRDVVSEHIYIDALCYELVRNPERFQVIVACNLFGDIVSDLVAGLGGGLGIAPSASLHPGGAVPGLFEPVHGSAPALAGRALANPIAMLRTVGMLLDWLGHAPLAADIERACGEAVEGFECTPDVGGTLDTVAAGEAVLRRLR